MSYQAGKQWYQARHAQLLIQRGKEEAQAKRVHIGQPSTTRAVMLRSKDPPRTRAEILRDRPSKYATRAKPTISTFRSVSLRSLVRLHECLVFPNTPRNTPLAHIIGFDFGLLTWPRRRVLFFDCRSEGDRMCAVKKHTSEAAMHEAQLQFGMGIRRCPVSSRNL
jgi:hypothetical protein